jgi:hypothetical protein
MEPSMTGFVISSQRALHGDKFYLLSSSRSRILSTRMAVEIKSISWPVGLRCMVIRTRFFTSHRKVQINPNRIRPRMTKTKIM